MPARAAHAAITNNKVRTIGTRSRTESLGRVPARVANRQGDAKQGPDPPRRDYAPTERQKSWGMCAVKYRRVEHRKIFQAYTGSNLVVNDPIQHCREDTQTDDF